MPSSLSARQQDICEPLFAIAEDCGGPWPQVIARQLADLLAEGNHAPTPENELLRAVRRFSQEQRRNHFLSREFCAWANAQEERPWSEKPLTPAKLAAILRSYDVFPSQINRIVAGRQKNCRGYFIDQFREAFVRYLD
jgi:hypothetical protein